MFSATFWANLKNVIFKVNATVDTFSATIGENWAIFTLTSCHTGTKFLVLLVNN